MYPDPRVAELISAQLLAARSHVKETPQYWGQFNVRWTPTVLFLDQRGREQHRVEGFLPTSEFLGQLHFGLGLCAAGMKAWKEAEQHFTHAANDFPQTDAGPAGLYWAGVARYSASHDAAELRKLWEVFRERYQDTSWAKRTVVWAPREVADVAKPIAEASKRVVDRDTGASDRS